MPILGPTAQADAYLRAGNPHLQACQGCGARSILPIVLCRECGSAELEWVPLEPRGTIYSITRVRRKPEHGGDVSLVLVDLEQGPRMLSRLVGANEADGRIGAQVVAELENTADGTLLVFRLGAPS